MSEKEAKLVTFPLHVPSEIEHLFDELIRRPWDVCRELRGWNPSVDVYESDDYYLLEADLPGVKLEDVSIEVESGAIVLRGYRSLEQILGDGRFRVMERSSGQFVRHIKLSEAVDESRIEAEFRDGVLRLTIPKTGKTAEAGK